MADSGIRRPPASRWYFQDSEGATHGASINDLVAKFHAGEIFEKTFVWNGTTVSKWTFLHEVVELKDPIQKFQTASLKAMKQRNSLSTNPMLSTIVFKKRPLPFKIKRGTLGQIEVSSIEDPSWKDRLQTGYRVVAFDGKYVETMPFSDVLHLLRTIEPPLRVIFDKTPLITEMERPTSPGNDKQLAQFLQDKNDLITMLLRENERLQRLATGKETVDIAKLGKVSSFKQNVDLSKMSQSIVDLKEEKRELIRRLSKGEEDLKKAVNLRSNYERRLSAKSERVIALEVKLATMESASREALAKKNEELLQQVALVEKLKNAESDALKNAPAVGGGDAVDGGDDIQQTLADKQEEINDLEASVEYLQKEMMALEDKLEQQFENKQSSEATEQLAELQNEYDEFRETASKMEQDLIEEVERTTEENDALTTQVEELEKANKEMTVSIEKYLGKIEVLEVQVEAWNNGKPDSDKYVQKIRRLRDEKTKSRITIRNLEMDQDRLEKKVRIEEQRAINQFEKVEDLAEKCVILQGTIDDLKGEVDELKATNVRLKKTLLDAATA